MMPELKEEFAKGHMRGIIPCLAFLTAKDSVTEGASQGMKDRMVFNLLL